MADTPNIWREPPPEPPHDHKGHSEEKCVRCGWVMGHQPLNCMNDDTPHRFPSQEAEVERLREQVEDCENDFHALKQIFDKVRAERDNMRAEHD